jgi:hypothetical protein
MRPRLVLLLLLALAPGIAAADGLTVLSVGKVATFKNGGGTVRVGRDPALASGPSPACPTPSAVEVSSYPVATQRVAVTTHVDLDCSKWKTKGSGFVYDHPAAAGGLRSVRYGRKGLVLRFGGAFTPPPGPVGYVQAWLTIGATRFNTRLHNFARNDAVALVTRKPSRQASTGEHAFWAVLHHDWQTPTDKAQLEQTALDVLAKAAKRDKKDGWSRFLIAMMHLYNFGQAVERFTDVSDTAKAEIAAAHTAFGQAVPLIWDGTKGDSRAVGFAAAATFALGYVNQDAAVQDQGIAELDAAFHVNPFFNVFDYIPVAQAVPAFDPRFSQVFTRVSSYLNDPGTLACVTTQPEICNNVGYAPRNTPGSLALFGDVEAKGGAAAAAANWYGLGLALAGGGTTPYRFLSELQERVATVDQRVALFRDADPGNDPTVIGAGPQACSACHAR